MRRVLLYDGKCGFCNSIVRFVLAHERDHTLAFAPLQSAVGELIISDNNKLQGIASVVWIEFDETDAPMRVFVRSTAALRLARYLGGRWRLLGTFWIVPRPLRDWIYDAVARNRHRIVGNEQCLVPTAETRHRFLDD